MSPSLPCYPVAHTTESLFRTTLKTSFPNVVSYIYSSCIIHHHDHYHTPLFLLSQTRSAVTKCKLHLLSFAKIQEAEEKDPKLALKLFKLLSFMMARREETTVAQLSTLHSIMTARAQKKPTSRLSTFSGHTPTKRHDSTQSDVSK